MGKKPYTFGGCTSHIARSENPYVRAQNVYAKLSPEQIAAEALGEVSAPSSSSRAIVVAKNAKRKASAALVENADDEQDAAELLGRSVFELENDPSLQAEGAVCNESGMLDRCYYKSFREAFKENERTCMDIVTDTPNRRGMRNGEELPGRLRVWDDSWETRRIKKKKKKKKKNEGGNEKKGQEEEEE